MANTKSAQKAHRQAERRSARNKPIRSAVRTFVKKATIAVAERDEQAASAVKEAVSALDRAVQKGIIHRNAAGHRKSRLMSRLYALSVAPEPTEAAAPTGRAGARKATSKTPSAKSKAGGAAKVTRTASARRAAEARPGRA